MQGTKAIFRDWLVLKCKVSKGKSFHCYKKYGPNRICKISNLMI